jgi:hypothetical protein
MCKKLYAAIVILVAIVLAVLVNNVSIDNVDNVMLVVKFFDVMIPVLAVGALIKYIACGHRKHCGCASACNCACGKCGCCKDVKSCGGEKLKDIPPKDIPKA